ncbi:MAG: class A beta-lactamase-related serine hydrolase [Chitinophagaceae bacterium]|nr:MAG: class A beta-lactamase-related serine hydrolase [Chitinophagaceae bacterium]
MKTFALTCIALLMALNAAFPQPAAIDSLRANAKVTGLQFVWIDKNKTTNYSLGTAFTGVSQKVTPTTIFQAASLSKVVLAYICMQLVAEKKINLDSSLYDYYAYPRIKNDIDSKKVTARMVLNHTSGWPNWVQNPVQKLWGSSTLKTQFEPGTRWSYSGEGFVFLQLVIQSILNKDFQEIAKERVFEPLGMKNSSFIWEERFAETATYGFNDRGEPTERSEYFLPNAAFSLLTTATDYALFLKALLKEQLGELLANEVPVKDLKKPAHNAKNLFWGLGIGVQKNELGKSAWHWGDNGDYTTFFIINPAKEQLLICFTNSVNGLKLMKPLANMYFGKASWYAADWL